MSWWVGGYIEAGAAVSGGGTTAYLPFVFQAATKAQAQAGAGAKLLAGPFSTQQQAQNWANSYEKNPSTAHAGTDIPAGLGQPVHGGGSGPGGTGASQGDNPPPGVSAIASSTSAVSSFLGNLGQRNLWLRIAKIVVGVALVIIGVAQLTHAQNIVATAAKGAIP